MAAITSAAIGAGTAIYSSRQASKQAKQASKDQAAAQEKADPYSQYRGDAAARLNALSTGKTNVTDLVSYKARSQAAERTMAAQGYTGSGNALLAAADAGGAAYQQEFDNLSNLAGVATGTSNATSAYSAGQSAIANANDNKLSATAGVANNITNLATTALGKFNSGATVNKVAGTGGGAKG